MQHSATELQTKAKQSKTIQLFFFVFQYKKHDFSPSVGSGQRKADSLNQTQSRFTVRALRKQFLMKESQRLPCTSIFTVHYVNMVHFIASACKCASQSSSLQVIVSN